MSIPSLSGLPPLDRTQVPPAAGTSRGAAHDGSIAGTPSPISADARPAASSAAEPPAQRIQDALKEVREAIAPVAQNLLFMVDEDTGRTVIKVVDSSTDEVIRQIPSEEILAIAKALDKLQGVLIQQKA